MKTRKIELSEYSLQNLVTMIMMIDPTESIGIEERLLIIKELMESPNFSITIQMLKLEIAMSLGPGEVAKIQENIFKKANNICKERNKEVEVEDFIQSLEKSMENTP